MGSWQQRKARHRERLVRLCPRNRVWRSAFPISNAGDLRSKTVLGLETGTIKLGIASGSGAYVREAGYGDLPFNTSTGDLRSVHVRGLETGTIKEKKQTDTPLTQVWVCIFGGIGACSNYVECQEYIGLTSLSRQ